MASARESHTGAHVPACVNAFPLGGGGYGPFACDRREDNASRPPNAAKKKKKRLRSEISISGDAEERLSWVLCTQAGLHCPLPKSLVPNLFRSNASLLLVAILALVLIETSSANPCAPTRARHATQVERIQCTHMLQREGDGYVRRAAARREDRLVLDS